MRRALFAALVLLAGAAPAGRAGGAERPVRIGSKKFTESVVLGEMAARLASEGRAGAVHRRELGGTRVLWNALRSGEIDAYVEYTGTIAREILAGENLFTDQEIRAAVAARDVSMSASLGFNNTYAIGMVEAVASSLGVETISDLRGHPDLRFAFTNEFLDRGDGWPSLRERYALPQRNVRGVDHDLAYRGLASGTVDAIDLYATDAEIVYYGLRVLRDDLDHFPRYDAVLLYRDDLAARDPEAVRSLLRLEGAIDGGAMAAMNARVKLDRIPEAIVAGRFLEERLGLPLKTGVESALARLLRRTREHLTLVGVSLLAAVLVSIPLGVLAAKRPGPGHVILAVAGVIQTIPSLALLVFMIPLLGIGGAPAVVALFLYSLLPIIRNTHAGLCDIAPAIRESAEALGLSPLARLRLVELPIASRSILAGIKTSAVINIGTATLGALIGAGGYGQPILTGIRLDDAGLILQGALPAAGLALAAQGLFEIAERFFVPEGLRIGAG